MGTAGLLFYPGLDNSQRSLQTKTEMVSLEEEQPVHSLLHKVSFSENHEQ